ncbi:MAG: rhodanese-like domain-containing protein [Verrucomicrobiota bacterium]
MEDPPLEITPLDLAALQESADEFRLIDCREDDEWQHCRIEGADLLPLSNFAEETARLDDLDARLIVYCHHGMRSLQATKFLRNKGFAQTSSLAGGIDAWSREIDPAVPRY